ncbi:MAG: retropepsin-like domain-containing protein [Alphaproteobacteria bacterium]|nr:retropepsin-like domain-containing protein [Alphaproteobacteria bacterium]
MPHLSGQVTPWGPLIHVIVSASGPRVSALTQAGQAAPQPVLAKLVVDTGASLTAIDVSILNQLGLSPTGKTPIHTPSTAGSPHQANQYDVGLTIFGHNNSLAFISVALPVIDGSFRPQGIDGLLGRDVLASSRMIYSGADSWYGLSF